MLSPILFFPSDAWIPDLKILCQNCLKYFRTLPGGKYLVFSDEIGTAEKPGRIVKEYHKTAKQLKLEVFGNDAKNSYIDYHKIAALYIRSFLKYKPFFLDIPSTVNAEPCLCVKLANEYFSLAFLEVIFRAWNNNYDGIIEMNKNYRDNFIKILHHYKSDIRRLDPLSFSNIIYLIEHNFFH